MKQLLTLVLYILAAIGIGWLVLWGAGEVGLPYPIQVILAAIIFVVVLIFGLNKTGVADV